MQLSLARLTARLSVVSAVFLSACSPAEVPAEVIKSEKHDFRVVKIAGDLDHPWGFTFLPRKGGILVTERAGRLRLVRDGKLVEKPIAGVPEVVDSGQGGLFEVVLHPRFSSNRFLYLSYAARGNSGVNTRVTRFRYDADGLALRDPKLIFDAAPGGQGGRHFGGRMVFDRSGRLYITTGDRGDMDRAQKLDDHSGSVIRLIDDGSVPPDNPFVGQAGAKPEIYSYGHRNPQGMALHPLSGAVWTHEHGARGGDEINVVRKGRNYGWPVITHGVDYDGTKIGIGSSAPGMEQPLYTWTPSIAPSGMAFYDANKFSKWWTNLFVGALAGQALVRLELNGEHVVREERLLEGQVGRIRAINTGPDGFLYFTTDDSSGSLLRLEPVR